ncbi:hypothetical protein [Geminocystis sp. GBBB08]|uniref:hypothetical protein n=1 Tax=Geminocystis sp. GBBB08 TaxID=2604140 RepID=UPI0027E31264|nr:hypothetical protein [Geminocystis sp. GBBB08]MBL1211058.1 hypothetical protein [Geminocystis sp. GBBB08]
MEFFDNKAQQAKDFLIRILKTLDREARILGNSLKNALVGKYIIGGAVDLVFDSIEKLKKLGSREAKLLKHAIGSVLGHAFSAMHQKTTWSDIATSQSFNSLATLFEEIMHLEDHVKIGIRTTINYLIVDRHLSVTA